MSRLIDIYEEEKICKYKGEVYSVRDNGSVMRHAPEGKKPRSLDNKWTFGKVDKRGYALISSEPVHRIVATAFLGEAPSKSHVVDHIDTNRQNNRPDNLRWLTRLENIVFNDITRTKLELLCGCTIDEILKNPSILQDKQLTPQYEWMKAVSKEEAQRSLTAWRRWAKEKSERVLHENNASNYFKTKKGPDAMTYPLEPLGDDASLERYFDNLEEGKVFCYKDYPSGRYSYQIVDYYLNKETEVLSVATHNSGGIKSLYLTSITLENGQYDYNVRSFFAPDGLEKYMTLARGEEWTGGEVFDDYL